MISDPEMCACGHSPHEHFRAEGFCFACRNAIPTREGRIAFDALQRTARTGTVGNGDRAGVPNACGWFKKEEKHAEH